MASGADARTLELAHYVSLSGFGGVEQQFARFATRAAALAPVRQSVVACSGTIHAHHQETLQRVIYSGREKYIRGVKLPHRPNALRRARHRWLAQRIAPDVALLWNRLGQQNRVLDALGAGRCLYWEHGSAWLAGEAREKARALARLPAVLCNSQAARRMLQLRWGYEGSTRVCLNGMRAAAAAHPPRTLAAGAALRLGVASRLVPIKATCLALHTLACLQARGLNVVLDIAGDGPERDSLETLAQRLGVSQSVQFLGVVQDMPAFYQRIDVLLHPALREPFGVVAAEAGARGVPVVCTAVDGLPEVVEHDVTGVCVPAQADLRRYRELGGQAEGLPEYVYVPATDRIEAPGVCEPGALADAVQAVIRQPQRYTSMSKNAMARVTERFDFDAHVREVLAAAREYVATGTLQIESVSGSRTLLHYVSLDGAGGVEQQFVEFLHAAARLYADHHAVVACGRGVHPLVAQRLAAADVPVRYEKYWRALKLPRWPPVARAARQRIIVRRAAPGAVVVWNRLRDSLDTLAAAGPDKCVYWERGASWFAGESTAKRAFLAEVRAVLCNSFAARRMLELRWGYAGQIRVCLNALRPSLRPVTAQPRTWRENAPVRLGVAARLEPIKGVALAIQALAALRADKVDAVLHIAGDGPERGRLEQLAGRLGVARHVVFAGLVADMGRFYQSIDLLVHPALREPFGQIAVEAGAYGCPAVVAGVDGLPEAIAHGETGLCVAPTRALEDYPALGGSTDGLPPYVYDPQRDTIDTPRLVEPQALADAVHRLVDAPDAYRAMSRAALAAGDARFGFDAHVHSAMQAIHGFAEHGTLHPQRQAP